MRRETRPTGRAAAAVALVALLLAFGGQAQPRFDFSAQPTAFGLYPVRDTEMARVFARPDAGLPFFEAVYVAPVSIAYRRDLSVDHTPIDPGKLQEMSEYLRQALIERVGGSGYALAEERELGALELRAFITDLRIGAGALAEEGTSAYFDSIAEMTLVIELADASTGTLLVQVADGGEAVRGAATDGPVTNREVVAGLLDHWAELVVGRLAEIKRMGGALAGR